MAVGRPVEHKTAVTVRPSARDASCQCMLSSLTLTVGVHAEKHRDWAGRDSERNTRTGAKLPILPLKVCRRASMTRDADVRHGLPRIPVVSTSNTINLAVVRSWAWVARVGV